MKIIWLAVMLISRRNEFLVVITIDMFLFGRKINWLSWLEDIPFSRIPSETWFSFRALPRLLAPGNETRQRVPGASVSSDGFQLVPNVRKNYICLQSIIFMNRHGSGQILTNKFMTPYLCWILLQCTYTILPEKKGDHNCALFHCCFIPKLIPFHLPLELPLIL